MNFKNSFNSFTRRGFLASLGAAALMPKKLFAASKADFDESLAVFLSDVHVNGLEELDGRKISPMARNYLAATVAEILRMDPLPRNVFIFGDLAHLSGRIEDYQRSYKDLKLLSDAGIKVTIGMGNHDHRKAFLEVWPDHAERTIIPGNIHTVTSLPDYDFIMLDSLDEKDVPNAYNPGGGKLSLAAQEWVASELPKWPRPFFLGAHHALNELYVSNSEKPLRHRIRKFPNCKGFIHGHNHVWKTNITTWISPYAVPWLTLPSNGFWGDIGYVVFRVKNENGQKSAVAELKLKDFHLHGLEESSPRPPAWNARFNDLKGSRCTFMI